MRKRVALSTGAAIFCVWLSAPEVAAADTITVTSGYLDWLQTTGIGVVSLSGSDGFTFESTVSPDGGIFDAWSQCAGTVECAPGSTIGLNASWSSNDLQGTGTLRGTTYSNVGGLEANDAQASIHFSGSVVAPPYSGGLVPATATFALSGLFSIPTDTSLERSDLIGHGIASLWLAPVDPGSSTGGYRLARIRYEVGQSAPVPEPASIFLLGAGVAGLAATRRRG